MSKILQIKISLRGSKPRIWRRILVEDSISFHKLHLIIQDVMGWEDYHLWEFKIHDYTITPDEEGYNASDIAIDKLMSSNEFKEMIGKQNLSKGPVSLNIKKMLKKYEDEEKKKEHFNIKTSINKIIKEKTKFDYCYDFGDCWEHSVIVEKILDKDSSKKYPVCIAGKMSSPPEDCGGIYGYYEMIEIKKDKAHPEYQEKIIDWLGEDFDFEKFDIDEVNERL